MFESRLSEVAGEILANVADQAEVLQKLQSTANEVVSSAEEGRQTPNRIMP